MMSFRSDKLSRFELPQATVWLLTDVAEAKGRQELYTRQFPQLLEAMRQTALVQSAESSNRIEGVTVAPSRLAPLVVGNARPRDRSEQEVQNYRDALNLVHGHARELLVDPQLVLRLHGIIQSGAGDAGQWKRLDNEIVELVPGRPPVVRFKPVAAAQTPQAVDELCRAYRYAVDQAHVQPLVATAAAVLDLLCIHPFRDGNGRVARIVSLVCLYHHGYEACRYVSLERLIEQSREDYYRTLHASSQGWHEGEHDLLPWLNYFVTILRRAYVAFEERAGATRAPRGAKRALVEQAVNDMEGSFALAELQQRCPGVSADMIRHVLRDLRTRGLVQTLSRGRTAKWKRKKR